MNWSPPTASASNSSRSINLAPTSDFLSTQPPTFYSTDPADSGLASSSSVEFDLEQRRIAVELAQFIRLSNLKIIAFDFDQTIVSIHTSGFWRESADRLADFVRPSFQYLITELLKNENLCIAVVTFSPQKELIKEVLRSSFKSSGNALNRIVIQGNTKEFVDKYGLPNCYYNGKQIHIAVVRDYFEASRNLKILNEDIILIDDDTDNISIARKNGHLAFEVGRLFSLNELQEFLNRVYGIEKSRKL